MGYQQYYRTEDAEAKYIGNGILFEGSAASALRSLGPVWGCKIKENITTVESKADNCDMGEIIDKQEGELSFSILAGHLHDIYNIRGGIDTFEATLAETATEVTDEEVTLNGTDWSRLANRMGDWTSCTISSVEEDAEESPATYVLDTDYEKEVDSAGYTRIRRKGAGIDDGETVLVTYTYKPALRETLYTGGLDTISSRYYRFLHVKSIDSSDKITGYMVDIYKGYLQNGSEIAPSADDNKKDPLKEPFTLKCKQDDTRTAGKRLWAKAKINGQTLADLGLDSLDKDELGTQIRAMIVENNSS